MESEILLKSYLKERRFIGIMGVLLPLLCWASCLLVPDKDPGWCSSMSATYYNSPILAMGLAIVAAFLFAYQGYDKTDKIVNRTSAICALVVALFPCSVSWVDGSVGIFNLPIKISNYFHCAAASILFASFVVNIMLNFTKGSDKTRNKLYYLIGSLMIFASIIFGLCNVIGVANVFLYEVAMLVLFGTAWLIKGKFLISE